ncbi:lectin-like domain-containing protein, partial [Enterococcus faecalis]
MNIGKERKINYKVVTLLLLAITQILYVGFNFTSAEAQGTVDSSRAVVDKDNFLYFFRLNGNSTYDASSGILTLTTDEKYKAGNAALKTQIDINSDFTLDGEVNIGNKNKAEKGADGISFGFHPNPTDIIGGFGSTLGLGNIPNAFGWKADTYYNAGEDRITGNGRFHAGPDPKRYETSSFGAFMYNQVDSADSEKIWTNTYDEPDAPAQEITRPTDNQFKPIKFVYSGYSKTLSVEYDGKRWSKQVDKYFVGELSTLLISASTGGSTNLQQFKLNKFDFVPNKGILETNKVSDVKEAKLGDIITYTIEAKNLNKDTSLLNVVVEDELPEGLELVPDTLAINGESVVNESIKENGIKTKLDVITYEVPIFITFNARVTKQDSGRLTNTAKVTTEYPEDSQTPTNDVDVTETPTPTRPVDPEGNEIPHEGIDFPSYPGKPGDKIVIPNKDIPEIPGYDKPTGDIEVTIPEPGNSIDIPYVPKKDTETPTRPVDPEGNEIPHEGIDFPSYPGKPGDKIV